jgi:hypothetical protein
LLPIVDHESDHSALCRPVNVGKPHHTRHSIEPSSPAAKADFRAVSNSARAAGRDLLIIIDFERPLFGRLLAKFYCGYVLIADAGAAAYARRKRT